jgi:Domain of unknown function (DUF4190)/GYF domain 2
MQINIGRSGQQLGTFSEEEVREGLKNGKFLPTDLGWHEGLADWQPLGSLSVLGGAVSPAPAPTGAPVSPQYVMHPMGAAPKSSGLALASMICGIVSLLLDMCCYLGVLAIPCSIAAIICGHMAMSQIKRSPVPLEGKGMAIAGLVCGYLSLIIMVAIIAVFVLIGITGSVAEGIKTTH